MEVELKKTPSVTCAGRKGAGGPDLSLPIKSQSYRVSWQYRSGSPENITSTKPAFIIEPVSPHQRNAISMAFHWWADNVPLIVVFGSFFPSSTTKKLYRAVLVGNTATNNIPAFVLPFHNQGLLQYLSNNLQ